MTTDSNLKWIPLTYLYHSNLFKKEYGDSVDELYKSLKGFSNNGFKVIPFEQKYSQDVDFLYNIKIVEFKISTKNIKKFLDSTPLNRINLSKSNPGNRSISIVLSPFSFTNPALFMNFISEGTINLRVVQEDGEVLQYISDVKYLENMVGGVVKQGEMNSIGLVLGNVRKVNGDGDLTLILSWYRILKGLRKRRDLSLTHLSAELCFLPTTTLVPTVPSSLCVLALTVEDHQSIKRHWGSCVLLDRETIVTNDHVINTDFSHYRIVIHVNQSTRIKLTVKEVRRKYDLNSKEDQIISPFKDLDLSYIKLSKENQAILNQSNPKFSNFGCGEYVSGNKVNTIGFGLYLPPTLEPLVSTGIISSISKFTLYDDVAYSQNTLPMPSLIITTSSCWNGSSGGGLFDSHTNKLIGIICSNAQVNIPDVLIEGNIGSYPVKTEKLSKFSLCIPIEIVLLLNKFIRATASSKINPRIINAWKLSQTHKEIVLNDSLPKL